MTAVMEKPGKLKLLPDDEYKKAAGVSQAEYARHRGVSRQAIHKFIAKGLITPLPNGNINVAAADLFLDANLNPAFTNKSGNPENTDSSAKTYYKAKAIRETYQAKLAELTYRERNGELVSAAEVKTKAFNMARILRDKLLNVADRVDAEVAAEGDRFRCHIIIKREIEKALAGI